MTTAFSTRIFAAIQPILSSIYTHPFPQGLADGTLPREQFLYYMQQDSLYLVDYARALAHVGAKATDPEDVALMIYFAEQAVVSERELHTHYFSEFSVTPSTEKGPACFMYCNHLLERAAYGSMGEGMAALLPCFWIYHDVGKHILQENIAGNPYEKWVALYSCQDFGALVDKAVTLTDRLAASAGEAERQRMMDAFIMSSRMEYCFWDGAFALNKWPV